MLADAALDAFLLIAALAPVMFMAWFAWWFLRAGKRYDEKERAAGRNPPP